MDFSERNRKVALSRWKNTREAQNKATARGKDADYWKAAVCGFLSGDGSVQIRREKHLMHHEIGFFPDDEAMLNTYLKAIKFLYKKEPSVRTRGKFFTVRMSSRAIVEDLLKNAGFGIKNWNLPQELFYNEKNIIAWLRAFFSAEGYVGRGHIKLQTVNQKGMLEVSKLLKKLGIDNNYYEYLPKRKGHSAVSIIRIDRRDARKLFYEKVGFWHAKKNLALAKSLDL